MTLAVKLFDQTDDAALCAALPAIAAALQRQANEDFAPAWNTSPIRVTCPVNVASDRQFKAALAPTDPSWPCFFIKTLDDPQALAYHTTLQGKPVLYVGRDAVMANGGSISTGSVSISSAASHELLETLADPYADFWASQVNLPDSPLMVALEVCDPVEGDSYDIDSIAVSNFITPEWFRAGVGPYDHLSKLATPNAMSPGGYLVYSDGTQKFGAGIAAWKANHVRRNARRLRRARRIVSV